MAWYYRNTILTNIMCLCVTCVRCSSVRLSSLFCFDWCCCCCTLRLLHFILLLWFLFLCIFLFFADWSNIHTDRQTDRHSHIHNKRSIVVVACFLKMKSGRQWKSWVFGSPFIGRILKIFLMNDHISDKGQRLVSPFLCDFRKNSNSRKFLPEGVTRTFIIHIRQLAKRPSQSYRQNGSFY